MRRAGRACIYCYFESPVIVTSQKFCVQHFKNFISIYPGWTQSFAAGLPGEHGKSSGGWKEYGEKRTKKFRKIQKTRVKIPKRISGLQVESL